MKFRALLRSAGLAALAFLFVFPLLYMLAYSLRPPGLPAPRTFELLALPVTLENYASLGRAMPLGLYLWNSLRVAGLAVPLTLLTASWAGLAMALLPRRERNVLLGLSLALLIVPGPALWVPRFVLFASLGLTDTIVPLVAPALLGTSPFYVLLFYLAFARVPRELYETAFMDGASLFQIWRRVALPLARPALIAVAVLSFTHYWNDYASPLLYLRSEANFTLPLGVQLLEQARRSNFPILMAACVVLAAPVVLLFGVAQRFFLQGQIALARWLQ
jgi:multiple sugar transport system permease protein